MPVFAPNGTYHFQQATVATVPSPVPANSITEAELANGAVGVANISTAVAGAGINGGSGVPLSVAVDGTTLVISGGTLSSTPLETTGLGASFTTGVALNNTSGIAADPTLGAYTADDESTPYAGIDNGQAGAVYAALADLENLRAAYENLRAAYEDNVAYTEHLVGLLRDNNLIA